MGKKLFEAPQRLGLGDMGTGDNGDTTFISGSLSPSRLPPLYGVQQGLGWGPAAPACPPARAAPASGTHGRGNARGNVFIQSRGGQKIRQKIQLRSELSLPRALRGAAIFGVRPQGWGRRPQIILLLPGCCWFSFSSFFFGGDLTKTPPGGHGTAPLTPRHRRRRTKLARSGAGVAPNPCRTAPNPTEGPGHQQNLHQVLGAGCLGPCFVFRGLGRGGSGREPGSESSGTGTAPPCGGPIRHRGGLLGAPRGPPPCPLQLGFGEGARFLPPPSLFPPPSPLPRARPGRWPRWPAGFCWGI